MKKYDFPFEPIFPDSEIPRLAASYEQEDDKVVLEAGQRIATGEFSRRNLDEIFCWKTNGRGKSRIQSNSDEEIAGALHLAAMAQTDRAAMAVLCGLNGVEVPVASAISMAIFPSRFTVIDFRALEALGCGGDDGTINFYLAYLGGCRKLAGRLGLSLRDLDRALWQWSKERSTLKSEAGAP